jgi:hypothetical protein
MMLNPNSARTKNEASPKEVAKVLRGALPDGLGEGYKETNLDKIIEAYEDVILDILYWTPRPTVALLRDAVLVAWADTATGVASMFAHSVQGAIVDCRAKSKSITSGAKTPAATQRIVSCLRKLQQSPLTKNLWQKTKILSRKESEEHSPQPAKRSRVQAAGSSSSATRSEVLALYGAHVAKLPEAGLPEEIHSSQEVMSSQDTAAKPYFDWAKLTMVRLSDSGMQLASMSAGFAGFAVATFADGIAHPTECSNAMLTAAATVVRKKPAAAPKKIKQEEEEASEGEEEANEAAAEACSLHRVRITNAKSPARTYITACQCHSALPSTHKQQLIVEFTLTRDGENHRQKAEIAQKYIVENGLDYAAARVVKTSLDL